MHISFFEVFYPLDTSIRYVFKIHALISSKISIIIQTFLTKWNTCSLNVYFKKRFMHDFNRSPSSVYVLRATTFLHSLGWSNGIYLAKLTPITKCDNFVSSLKEKPLRLHRWQLIIEMSSEILKRNLINFHLFSL